ncbi:hypothetical protein PIIN_11358 [Serendipita indica DSM 11827]|uniref:Uncharacterized protein n=1 Tax=Serendipita indica (strain DSM 11827) TaxID=1109443 RepID=G4U1D8_SERID|nr:hypothetical protein PIIN_11358 [Serendipita indica DSM 11827]
MSLHPPGSSPTNSSQRMAISNQYMPAFCIIQKIPRSIIAFFDGCRKTFGRPDRALGHIPSYDFTPLPLSNLTVTVAR